MNRIEFYSTKKKALILLLGSLLFVVIGLFLLLNTEELNRHPDWVNYSIKIIGIISIVFFGFGIYVSLEQLFTDKLMLIIDDNGINVNPKNGEYISWSDINGFEELMINKTKIINIKINNANKYIENESNQIRKKLMMFNFKNHESPYQISVGTMNTSYNELLNALIETHKRHI